MSPDWLKQPWTVWEPVPVLELALVALLWSLEALGVEVDGDCCCCCVCVAFGSWELLGVPEDGDCVCAKAMLLASKKVADVNKAAFFIVFLQNRYCPVGVRFTCYCCLPPAVGFRGRTYGG